MSAPSPRLALTKRAQRDVRAIEVYTLRTWGPEQALAYDAAIEKAFDVLRNQPRIGTVRDEIRLGLWSFPAERHILYYRLTRGEIEILRILHERADAMRQLGPRRSR